MTQDLIHPFRFSQLHDAVPAWPGIKESKAIKQGVLISECGSVT